MSSEAEDLVGPMIRRLKRELNRKVESRKMTDEELELCKQIYSLQRQINNRAFKLYMLQENCKNHLFLIDDHCLICRRSKKEISRLKRLHEKKTYPPS